MVKNIFLVIPVYNEHKHLDNLLKKVGDFFPLNKVIVVDDGSQTPITTKYPVNFIRHPINLGKGAALKTGIIYAFRQQAQAIIIMDGDNQHDPKELPIFIRHLKDGKDLVFGSRQLNLDVPLIRYLGNKFASIYLNLMFGVYVSDVLSGYRGISKKAYQLVRWQSARYAVEAEMIARLGMNKKKLTFLEFPIQAIYLDKYKGLSILDAISIFISSIWWKLSSGFRF